MRWILAPSPMPFGVQSLIPCINLSLEVSVHFSMSPMPFGVQSLIPGTKTDETYYFLNISSPMPFGVQSLIPPYPPESNRRRTGCLQCLSAFSPLFPRIIGKALPFTDIVSNAFRRSVPYSREYIRLMVPEGSIGLQCLSAFSPLFPVPRLALLAIRLRVVSNAFRRSVPYSRGFLLSVPLWPQPLSPMPFGVQSLIPASLSWLCS